MKLHPQNPTPGGGAQTPEPRPVTANELFEVLELLADGLERSNQNSYYYGAAKRRLKTIKERL
jgi:hypothetical protein